MEKKKKKACKDKGRVQRPAVSSSYSNEQTGQLLVEREKVLKFEMSELYYDI